MTNLEKYVTRTARTCFIYRRVSTDDQENNTSLDQQEQECREEAKKRGIVVLDVFSDVYTGAVWEEREGLQAMRRRYAEVDYIFFRTYDRLSREPAHYYILTDELKRKNVETVCVKESNDTSIVGELIRMFLLSFAKLERQKTEMRTGDGKRLRVTSKRLYNAGKKPPYGYLFRDKEKSGLIPHPLESKTVQRIFEMRAARCSYYAIAEALTSEGIPAPLGGECWYDATVKMLIKRGPSLYSGHVFAFQHNHTKQRREGKLVTVQKPVDSSAWLSLPEGTAPALITPDLLRAVQEVQSAIKQDATRNNHSPEDGLLRNGFARCGVCGTVMTVIHMKGRKEGQRYATYACNGPDRHKSACGGLRIMTHILDTAVWTFIEETRANIRVVEEAAGYLFGSDLLRSAGQSASNSILALQRQIAEYKEDLDSPNLSRSARRVILEEIGSKEDIIEELLQEQDRIETAQVAQEEVEEEYRRFLAWCEEKAGEESTYQEKRDALRYLGVSVRVYPVGDERGRHPIQLAPTRLIELLNIGSRSSRSCTSNTTFSTPFLLRNIDGRILFYSPDIDILTPTS